MTTKTQISVGAYLATRLEQAGIRHYFGVPGDFNLVLLDQLLMNQNLKYIGCCNELNAGYAADGYARANGVAAVVVTYSVGGLSVVNAIAGAYAENLSVIVISGGPNSNSEAENEVVHHGLGEVRYGYPRDIFATITAESVIISHPSEAPTQIDRAIATCLAQRKPVYLEIACNIAGAVTSTAQGDPCSVAQPISDPSALKAAVNRAATMLNQATKPVLVTGVNLQIEGAIEPFLKLVEASGYAVAAMPNAKGLFSEQHPNYIGIYWGPVSSLGTSEIVESADAYLFAGATFSDYTTCGHTALIDSSKLIHMMTMQVRVAGQVYNSVFLPEFLAALAAEIQHNDTSLVAFNRIRTELAPASPREPGTPLTTRYLFQQIQQILNSESVIIAETGDSWFNSIKLTLPEGCRHVIQMQYGSIGWSVGATLGYELGSIKPCRVIALIGDGSFQLTAQEVSTMIRYGLKPIIFLINNAGYVIEIEIHDGPYNNIQNWNYCDLIQVFNGKSGNGWGCCVQTDQELEQAVQKALSHDGVSFIEVVVERDDCSKELLEWGSKVGASNARSPKIL